MSSYQPIVKVLSASDLSLPEPKEGVEKHVAENRREALKSNTHIILNKEEGANSVQLGIAFDGIRGVMGFTSDAEANSFIADQNDDDIHNELVLAGALAQKAFEDAEIAKFNDDEGSRANAEDILLCLNTVTDSKEIADDRLYIAQRNQDEWPSVRKRFLKNDPSNKCAISEQEIDGVPDVDHIKLQSEYPEHALNQSNLRKSNKPAHDNRHIERTKDGKKFIARNDVKTPSSLVGRAEDE
ncbi:hypothetical protein BBM20_11875 [Vibrio parahaemolyticus]|uniref:hypothetical protein n=1 Tax=Vibrio parahaemolyticus TaxID=670 RepID=UPI00084B2968|nr:hypothetical protein [Vibrio parahaemolyticus]EGQ8003254.1 hypothetical protein [Vibrio parahaemolyticus]EJC7017075.1 hypothetical protein [Vibrio parahaemolyticus]ODY30780.1 hypothetical protein BBM20_11875 [Vibrio parahaemolyticus]